MYYLNDVIKLKTLRIKFSDTYHLNLIWLLYTL